jgi:hypothetical protein
VHKIVTALLSVLFSGTAFAQGCVQIGRECVSRNTAELRVSLGDEITDLNPLVELPLLTSLSLYSAPRFNEPVSIAPLATLSALKRLRFNDLNIPDLEPLLELTHLESLTL